MAPRSAKQWLLGYDATTIFRLWDSVRKRVHTSRDVTFNEAELAGSKDVGDPSQGATAPATTASDTSTIPTTTANTEETDEDAEDGPVAGRTRKATNKAELPKKALQKAVGATEAPMKFVGVIILPRDPNIVYEELYEEDLPLPKTIIAKLVTHNEDKPSYETAMAGSETS
jgi:hypothetical protein